MALTKLTANVSNIQSLADLPNDDQGLTAEQVKATFDKAGEDIKEYINNTLTPEIDASLQNITGQMNHTHTNLTVLNGLTDSEGVLLYNGEPIQGAGGTGGSSATDIIYNVQYPPSPLVGVVGDGVADDTTALQNILDVSSGKIVIFPKLNYLISSALKVKDNTRIIIADGANIILKSGSNSYIFRNEDWVNGNKNITIEGGSFKGNAVGQTRIFGTTLENSYYGFGILMYKVTGLKLRNMYLEETNSWAIAYMSCNDVEIDDIRLWQTEDAANNGDGVTGSGNNIRISNIRGFTNDDLVAVSAYGAQIGDNELLFPVEDVTNVTITNIFPEKRGTTYPWNAVALYARGDKKMKNVHIDNIKGTAQKALVEISNPRTGNGYFENIEINNVAGNSLDTGRAVIRTYNVNIKNLIIDGMQRIEDSLAIAQIGIFQSTINCLTVSNVQFEGSSTGQFIYDTGSVGNIILDNIHIIKTGEVGRNLYEKNSSDTTTVTRIVASGINLVNTLAPISILSGKAALNCTDFETSKTLFTPRKWDKIIDSTDGLLIYNGSAWVNGAQSSINGIAYYKEGVEATAYTGGLVAGNHYTTNGSTYNAGGAGQALKLTSELQLNIPTGTASYDEYTNFCTASKVNLAAVRILRAKIKLAGSGGFTGDRDFFLQVKDTNVFGSASVVSARQQFQTTSSAVVEVTLDVTTLTGSYYIMMFTGETSTSSNKPQDWRVYELVGLV